MALDADPNYYALDPQDAGAQPGDTSGEGLADPTLAGPLMGSPSAGLPALLSLLSMLTGNKSHLPSPAMSLSPALSAVQGMAGGSPPAASGSGATDPGTADPTLAGPLMDATSQPGGLNALMDMLTEKQSSSPDPALSPALSALSAQANGTSPSPMVPGVGQALPIDPGMSVASPLPAGALAPIPAASQAGAVSTAGNGAPAGDSAPAHPALTMPTMPRHNDTVLQILGTLSALAGGPGARIASQYLQNRGANDTQNYNQQVQAYQQQQHDTQQAQDNQNQQSENAGKFVEGLSKLDPATQEQTVRNLTPADMAADGFTAEQVQKQFFDASGKFIPVSAADKPDNPAATARAQASARNTLSRLTPEGQQSYHDSFKGSPDDWVQQTGLPFENFNPLTTAKDVTAAGTLAEKVANDAATQLYHGSQAQNANYKTFLSLSPALQQVRINGYASHPQDAQNDLGVPLSSLQPGQTEANMLQSTAIANRETDATRSDQTRNRAINLEHLDRASALNYQNLNLNQRTQYDNRMLDLKSRGLTDQEAYNVARIGIAQQSANTNSIKLSQAVGNKDLALAKQMIANQKNASILAAQNEAGQDAKGNALAPSQIIENARQMKNFQDQNVELARQRATIRAQASPAIGATRAMFGFGGPMRSPRVTAGSNGVPSASDMLTIGGRTATRAQWAAEMQSRGGR